MNYRDDFDKIHNKLDNVENKLDNHLSRISTAETHISWLRGHVRIATTLLITIGSGLLIAALKFFTRN